MALARLARSRVLPESEKDVGVPLDGRLDCVDDLVRAGESAVAFEILSDNLLDYGIRLTPDDFAEAASLAEALGVSRDRYVAPLQPLTARAEFGPRDC